MSSSTWYYRIGDDIGGPHTERELAALLAARTLTPESLVRHDDPDPWLPLKDVFGFARTPPALPPASELFLTAATDPNAWTDTSPHPWRRYFARMLDLLIFSSLSWFIIGFVFAAIDAETAHSFFAWQEGRAGTILTTLLGIPLAATWCAVLLGYTGGTPGKWLFGVRITDANGYPPGLAAAAQRETMVWILGLGLAIPLVSLFTLISSYSRLNNERTTLWDERLNLVATHRTDDAKQVLLAVTGFLVWGALWLSLRFAL